MGDVVDVLAMMWWWGGGMRVVSISSKSDGSSRKCDALPAIAFYNSLVHLGPLWRPLEILAQHDLLCWQEEVGENSTAEPMIWRARICMAGRRRDELPLH